MMTYAQKVRESYGDSVEVFARRMCVLPQTVEGWENGVKPQATALALLRYAEQWPIALEPRISPEFAELPLAKQLEKLAQNFGDNQKQFARRIGLMEYNLILWKNKGTISDCAQRYLYEVAMHPERFIATPKSFAK